jgi:uncharacterized protein (TIGR04255 family)
VSEQPYKQPPITEAVIEIRFAVPNEDATIAKASADFKSHYPQENTVTNVAVQLYLPTGPEIKTAAQTLEKSGYRRSSTDQTQLLLLWPDNFVISQLAPYPGWDAFFERFSRDWEIWKRAIGYRKISRIGVRYINRIDIPLSGPFLQYEQFLNIYAHLPESLGPVSSYAVQAQMPLPKIGCKLTLNSGIVPSPVLRHVSFVFDQDIGNEETPPQNDEGIYKLLNEIRVKKNSVFESCVTDQARRLFNP